MPRVFVGGKFIGGGDDTDVRAWPPPHLPPAMWLGPAAASRGVSRQAPTPGLETPSELVQRTPHAHSMLLAGTGAQRAAGGDAAGRGGPLTLRLRSWQGCTRPSAQKPATGGCQLEAAVPGSSHARGTASGWRLPRHVPVQLPRDLLCCLPCMMLHKHASLPHAVGSSLCNLANQLACDLGWGQRKGTKQRSPRQIGKQTGGARGMGARALVAGRRCQAGWVEVHRPKRRRC